MGWLGRLKIATCGPALSGLLACGVVAAAGCGDSEPQAGEGSRRRHLMPRDLQKERSQKREAERTADDQGALLPSDELAGGVRLPRGMRKVNERPNRWYFQTRASLEALRAYFGPRLSTGQVELAGRGTVTYVKARPKDTEAPRTVSVRIGPAPDNPRENQVYISEHIFKPVEPVSRAQAEAQIEARRKYAD